MPLKDSLIDRLKAVEVLMLNDERYEYANAVGMAIAAMGDARMVTEGQDVGTALPSPANSSEISDVADDTLTDLWEKACRDDWHLTIMGSEVRSLIATVRALRKPEPVSSDPIPASSEISAIAQEEIDHMRERLKAARESFNFVCLSDSRLATPDYAKYKSAYYAFSAADVLLDELEAARKSNPVSSDPLRAKLGDTAINALMEGKAAVVPIEPTEEMWVEGGSVHITTLENAMRGGGTRACWETMLRVGRLDTPTQKGEGHDGR